jgi:hypothetical protein
MLDLPKNTNQREKIFAVAERKMILVFKNYNTF